MIILRKLRSLLRLHINNIKARINRILAEAGFGGGIVNGYTTLEVKQIRNGKVIKTRKVYDKCVTNAFVNDIVDSLQGSTPPYTNFKNYKYHGSGTGSAAEAAADTALGTEVESRVSGTQVDGSSTNIYQSIGTITYASAHAITEHGLFNAATGGTLMDRTVFPSINVLAGDSVQFSFSICFQSGG
jgi:hypothetical protein